jgi:phosphoribulokinase
MLVSFLPHEREENDNQTRLDAELILRDSLPHPNLTPFVDGERDGLQLVEGSSERILRISGCMDPDHAAAIEEAIWSRMHFATHLRARRLGEFTIGTELYRSQSLALVQLLILYHVVTAKAAVALGGDGTRNVEKVIPVSSGAQAGVFP